MAAIRNAHKNKTHVVVKMPGQKVVKPSQLKMESKLRPSNSTTITVSGKFSGCAITCKAEVTLGGHV